MVRAKKLTISGMFAALIFVTTMFVKIPVVSGYIHFGDALLYIAALVLDAPYAIAAGVIGESLADLAGGYAMYMPATAIIKFIIALIFTFSKTDSKKILSKKPVLMTVPAAIITVGGYFVADLIIDKSYAIVDISGNVIQTVGSAVIFIIIAAALDKMKIFDKII